MDRRPGLDKIIEQLRAKHPRWSEDLLRAQAKAMWHERPDDELPRNRQPPGRDGKTLCEDRGHQWTLTGKCAACNRVWTVQEFLESRNQLRGPWNENLS